MIPGAKIREIAWKVIRYGFVGGVAAAGAWITSVLAFSLGHWPSLVSQGAGFVTGTGISYPLSRWWAFRNHSPQVPQQIGVFIVMSLGGLGVNELGMSLVIHYLHWWVPVGMAFGLVVGFIWNFTAHNWVTFRQLS